MSPKLPRLTAQEAETLLEKAGFVKIRSKDSHRIYRCGNRRCVLPFHAGKALHPKLVKQVFDALEAGED